MDQLLALKILLFPKELKLHFLFISIQFKSSHVFLRPFETLRQIFFLGIHIEDSLQLFELLLQLFELLL